MNRSIYKEKRGRIFTFKYIAITAVIIAIIIGGSLLFFFIAGRGERKNDGILTSSVGYISIISTPSGASVYINREYKGETPLTTELKTGKYSVKVEKKVMINIQLRY